jgi:hypothetical protein
MHLRQKSQEQKATQQKEDQQSAVPEQRREKAQKVVQEVEMPR